MAGHASHGDTERAAALAAFEAEEAQYQERLASVHRVAGEVAVELGRSAYAATDALRQAGVPAPGDTHRHDGFNADYYSAAGLQHELEQRQAQHARTMESVRTAVRNARRQYRVSLEQGNRVLEAAGIDPAVVSTRVTARGTLRFTVPGTLGHDAATALLQGKLGEIEGITAIDTGSISLETEEA